MTKSTLPDKSGIPEILKKYSQHFESLSTNVSIVGKDLLIQVIGEKTLYSKGFTSNVKDILT